MPTYVTTIQLPDFFKEGFMVRLAYFSSMTKHTDAGGGVALLWVESAC